MFFDELPPDTSVYMLAGYSIFFLITLIYVASLFIRARNLNRDLATLDSLQQEQRAPAPSARKPASAPKPSPARSKASARKSTASKSTKKKTARKK